MDFPGPPVVVERGGHDAPLVVLLHGRGSHETEIIALADHLRPHLAYAAVHGPNRTGESTGCGSQTCSGQALVRTTAPPG